ncbi:DUF2877 domain-containing protein [Citrobacter rodentium]|nr:DUF2877 domain-containing protein [Citrobacter rodentium]KIQ51247.1 cytoplasmic protein [Citrobacter rodentium]QBY31241.1 DUF2877 domain-containing protein [Citrobacter rodentium]UHO31396.1 DUF2877 domain-containing protein [Citrobacter rodentium NBRC 105723 = DSM 16636]HAT8013049.1 DUF2877 domain-containing protein [Citrobacter rodentium NBRC 105723 = DSM 16636]HAT8017647.1 DUF2877 domain-containing protein [Citrobacter rodentium]
MVTFNALASAGLYRLPDGEWTLHSRFSQAINFIHAGGKLLTLYRYGKGMGPSGVLLPDDAFSRCIQLEKMVKRDARLYGRGIILQPLRQLALRLTPGDLQPVNLTLFSSPTGLGGPLKQAVASLSLYPQIAAQLARWRDGYAPDWHWLIGRGPGLTPSGDDLLTGMMAVFHAAEKPMPLFLPPADQLVFLTTSVSCSYLNSARVGEFSTPVLKVIRRLQSGRSPQSAIRRLLAVGHTSGADILLGIAIAQRWLQAVDFKGNHAGSGNHSYIYPRC